MIKWKYWNLVACYAWAFTGTINFCHGVNELFKNNTQIGLFYLFICILNVGASLGFYAIHKVRKDEQ